MIALIPIFARGTLERRGQQTCGAFRYHWRCISSSIRPETTLNALCRFPGPALNTMAVCNLRRKVALSSALTVSDRQAHAARLFAMGNFFVLCGPCLV